MGLQIEDGTGDGFRAGVTSENQLKVESEVHELQHHISLNDGQVYQVIGTHILSGAGTLPILHITNDDPDRDLLISYMRIQFIGDGTIDTLTYWQCGFGKTYSSGGAEVTPVNMNAKSGNVANVTSYNDNPTLGGVITEFDRWYANDGMHTFNKHGSLILGLSDTMVWNLITDQTTGIAYARVTIMMNKRET